jgi:hypothetical protein
MKKWMLLLAVTAGMCFAGVKTYDINLFDNAVVGATHLKPGDYQLRVEGSQAIFLRYGKTVAQANIKVVDNAATKYAATEIDSKTVNGANQVREIRLAGTRMALDFQN